MGADSPAPSIDGDQIRQDFAHVPDRKRIMTFTFHVARFAIRKSRRDVLGHARRKGTIFRSMPETRRNIDLFQTKSTRRGKDFGGDGQPSNRCSQGAASTYEVVIY